MGPRSPHADCAYSFGILPSLTEKHPGRPRNANVPSCLSTRGSFQPEVRLSASLGSIVSSPSPNHQSGRPGCSGYWLTFCDGKNLQPSIHSSRFDSSPTRRRATPQPNTATHDPLNFYFLSHLSGWAESKTFNTAAQCAQYGSSRHLDSAGGSCSSPKSSFLNERSNPEDKPSPPAAPPR